MLKGILQWFKPKVKMKRWLFLIIVSTALICYEFSKVLSSEELQIFDVLKTIVGFVLGFAGIVIGFVFSQRRMLELIVESSVPDEKGNTLNVKSLFFNKKVFDRGPKIVAIGGGTGLSTMLRGLKLYTTNITAVVTTSDDGRNTGTLRRELGIVPPGDIRQCIVALSNKEPVMEKLFQYRFEKGTLSEMNFGNLYLVAMSDIYNNFAEGVKKTSEVLAVTGKVLPVSLDDMNICAELEDGTIVEGESQIPNVVQNKVTKIKKVYINPTNCMPLPEVIKAIKEADAIILGPGSLYTSVMPNLLVRNVSSAIKESKAMKIYVSNIMTQPGETDNYTVSDHIQALQDHFGKDIIDFCICDSGDVMPEFVKKYNLDGSEPVSIDYDKIKQQEVTLIEENLCTITDNYIRHDSKKLSQVIMKLVCEDLKFNNKQNVFEYLMLKYKLKKEEKKEKRKSKLKAKSHSRKKNIKEEDKIAKKYKDSKRGKKNSKFTEKYKDRIESIQKSNKK